MNVYSMHSKILDIWQGPRENSEKENEEASLQATRVESFQGFETNCGKLLLVCFVRLP